MFSEHCNVLQSIAYKGQSDAENIAQDILMRKQLADGQFDADNFWPDIRREEVGGHLGDVIGTLAGTLGAEGVDSKAGGGDSKWMSLSDTRAHSVSKAHTHKQTHTYTQAHTYAQTHTHTHTGTGVDSKWMSLSDTCANSVRYTATCICIFGSFSGLRPSSQS